MCGLKTPPLSFSFENVPEVPLSTMHIVLSAIKDHISPRYLTLFPFFLFHVKILNFVSIGPLWNFVMSGSNFNMFSLHRNVDIVPWFALRLVHMEWWWGGQFGAPALVINEAEAQLFGKWHHLRTVSQTQRCPSDSHLQCNRFTVVIASLPDGLTFQKFDWFRDAPWFLCIRLRISSRVYCLACVYCPHCHAVVKYNICNGCTLGGVGL